MLTHGQAGYRRPLEPNDIWLVPDARAIESLQGRLKNSFRKRVSAQSRFPLAWALYETFRFDFWFGGICQLLVSILQVMAPFTLRYLIKFANNAYTAVQAGSSPPSISVGIGYVLGITGMQILQSFASSHYYYRSMLFGGQSRSALVALVLDKSLKLSRRAKAGGTSEGQAWRTNPKGWSNGRIMNLISTDASRIEQACGVLHLVWTSPIQIVLTVALLSYNMGYSALAGVAILICGLAGLTKVMGFLTASRSAINKITDRRVDMIQEMLQGIRFVKYFALENFFLSRLTVVRAEESDALRLMNLIKSAIGAVSQALPIFSNMTAFIVFSVTSHALEPAVVFSSLAMFNSLRTPMNWLPISIGYVSDAYISLKRIEDFLLAEEVDLEIPPASDLKHSVELDHATFTWETPPAEEPEQQDKVGTKQHHLTTLRRGKVKDKTSEEQISPSGPLSHSDSAFRLENLTFEAGRAELIGIVGSVGCGKTSLLSALASDMRQIGGRMEFSAERAYCPQYAWIQNTSIRNNIIFGKPFDQAFYSEVVQACALEPDFEALPDGDATEIGERGITLSGGQKQRINIARAIYSDASIVLLDDPLSAVDAHVGAHLFNEAICGLLRSKCRIMATHQIHLLSRFDKIIWMVDGRIEAFGPYQELMHTKPAFAKLVTAVGPQHLSHSSLDDEKKDSGSIRENAIADGADTMQSPQKLMQEDIKAVNSVPWSVYVAWLRSSGSLWNIFAVLIMQALFRASNLLTSVWLSWWVSNKYGLSRGQNVSISILSLSLISFWEQQTNRVLKDWLLRGSRRNTRHSAIHLFNPHLHSEHKVKPDHVQRSHVANPQGTSDLLRHNSPRSNYPPLHQRRRRNGQQSNQLSATISDCIERARGHVYSCHCVFLLRELTYALSNLC